MDGLKVEVVDPFCIREECPETQENLFESPLVNYSPTSEEKAYSLPSALGEHFSVQQAVGDGTMSGMCHSCGATLKFTVRATSNLITHLKRCDPNRYEMYCQNRKSKRARRSSPVEFGSVALAAASNCSWPANDTTNGDAQQVFERSDIQPTASWNTSHVSKPIMKHFRMYQLTARGNMTARCLNCGGDVKASLKASSNLITHLKRCSPIRFERYCQDRNGRRSYRCRDLWQDPTDINLSSTILPFPAPTSIENAWSDIPDRGVPQVTDKPVDSNSISKETPPATHSADRTSCHQMFGAPQSKQRKMVKSLVLSAASDHVPYDTILRPNVQNFLAEADSSFVLPDRDTMNDVIIPLCAQKIQEKITSELQHVDRVYLIITIWIDKNSISHASFRINFINDEWIVVERHLGNYATESKLNPSSLVSMMEKVMERFKITSKAEKILLDNTIPFADDLNHICLVTSQYSSKNLSDCEFSTLLSFLPKTIGSVTQRLRKIVIQSIWGDDTTFSPIRIALKKAVNLIIAVSHSPIALEHLKRRSIDICDIRSLVSLLEAVTLISENLSHFNVVLGFLDSPYNDSVALTASEHEILKEISEIFNTFVTTVKCHGDNKIRAIAPAVRGLMTSFDSPNHFNFRHCDAIRSCVINLSKEWLGPFLTCDDVAIASFLDPRFKLNWLESQSDKDALLLKVKSLIASLTTSNKTADPAQSSVTDNSDVINAACRYYLSEPISSMDIDPLLYWKCCPTTLLPLASLARVTLVCIRNFCTCETLDHISAWERCYQVFSDEKLRGHLSFIDRNKHLFQSSL